MGCGGKSRGSRTPSPQATNPPSGFSVKATSGAAAAGGGNPGGEEGVGARAEDIRTCVPGISAYSKTKPPCPWVLGILSLIEFESGCCKIETHALKCVTKSQLCVRSSSHLSNHQRHDRADGKRQFPHIGHHRLRSQLELLHDQRVPVFPRLFAGSHSRHVYILLFASLCNFIIRATIIVSVVNLALISTTTRAFSTMMMIPTSPSEPGSG